MFPIILTQNLNYTAPLPSYLNSPDSQSHSQDAWAVLNGNDLVKRCVDISNDPEAQAELLAVLIPSIQEAWGIIPREDNPKKISDVVPLCENNENGKPGSWKGLIVKMNTPSFYIHTDQLFKTPGNLAQAWTNSETPPPAVLEAVGRFMQGYADRWANQTGGECMVLTGHPDPYDFQGVLDREAGPHSGFYFNKPHSRRDLPKPQAITPDLETLLREVPRMLPRYLLNLKTPTLNRPSSPGRL